MARLTKKQVLHVAELSNLKLSDAEIKKFTPQLDKIIEFVEVLNEVDTKDVLPTSQTAGLKNVLREDAIKPSSVLTVDEAVSGTDNIHNGLVKVPAILTERTIE